MATLDKIKLGGALGGYTIVNRSAISLPQDLASGFVEATTGHLGATFEPIWYVGHQLVNGKNHSLICKCTGTDKNFTVSIVELVINIPSGARSFTGEGAKIAKVNENAKLDAKLKKIFDTAVAGLIGVEYKPVMYIGYQVADHGKNHFIVCEAKAVYPKAVPFAATLCINEFNNNVTLVSVTPLSKRNNGTNTCFGAPLGEWP